MDESLREKLSRDLFVNQVRKWEDLPTDCLVHIFEKVDTESLIEYVPLVCKTWYKASLDPHCWKILDFEHLNLERSFDGELPVGSRTTQKIKFAVKRSYGMATKVVFPNFQAENIVQYVLERCAALKSLILPEVSKIAYLECVPKLIYKWKDLESLTLPHNYYLEEVLAQIHAHCNNFVSLTVTDAIIISEVAASAIVTFVPNIKHLVLNLCDISRENLILLLSGCRDLELLVVTDCICIGFDADDAELLIMASHIKTFHVKGFICDGGREDYGSDPCYHAEYGSDNSKYHDDHFNYTLEGSSVVAEEEYGFDFFCHDEGVYPF